MKHIHSIAVFAFAAVIILTACSHKSAPAAAVPQQPAPAFNMMANTEKMVADGQKIFSAKCGRCHGLKDPSDYSAGDWNSIMRSMAPKAKLNETEAANVLAYVTKNARSK